MEPQAYLCLVLHAHLPFVRHPESECLEERWLYEAINECYLPLLQVFDQLLNEGLDFRMTISISPPLISMLGDALLQERFSRYLDLCIELAEKETFRNKHHPTLQALSRMYFEKFSLHKRLFEETYNRNLVAAFLKLHTLGKIQLITSPATHGYLPVLRMNPASVKAQVKVAVDYYRSVFGHSPQGMWLSECGYYPGLDELLSSFGLGFFFTETHAFQYAKPQPKYAVYAPVYCPSGVAAFGRDPRSARQVWSAQYGYPAHGDYREFYRDAGHELDYEYIRPYIHQNIRVDTGLKYYRITGSTDRKEHYDPLQAEARTEEHAQDFFQNHLGYSLYLQGKMRRPPLFVAPYDAELFGHWWYEGPKWLYFLLRHCAAGHFIKTITPSEYLERYSINQVVQPIASSWGWKGYHEMWLNQTNNWIYPSFFKAGQTMESLAGQYAGQDGLIRQTLNQAARELLLAQASDWAFIMTAKTMPHYAIKRTLTHLEQFHRLCLQVDQNKLDAQYVFRLEQIDNLFPDLDYEVYL